MSASAKLPGHEDAARPATILIMDPDPDAREICRLALESAGYRVAAVGDGEECVRTALLATPDLVITELFGPRLDGFGIAERLGSRPGTASIPVVAFTTCSLPSYRERARRLGFVRYLLKPLDPLLLIGEVRSLLAGCCGAGEVAWSGPATCGGS